MLIALNKFQHNKFRVWKTLNDAASWLLSTLDLGTYQVGPMNLAPSDRRITESWDPDQLAIARIRISRRGDESSVILNLCMLRIFEKGIFSNSNDRRHV